jgi:hypothetical protein
MSHVTPDEAGKWVSGLLDVAEAARIEHHVQTCPRCERRLQAEARIEMALAEATDSAPLRKPTSRPVRWGLKLLAPVALAAGLTLHTIHPLYPEVQHGGPDASLALEFSDIERIEFSELRPPPEANESTTPFPL